MLMSVHLQLSVSPIRYIIILIFEIKIAHYNLVTRTAEHFIQGTYIIEALDNQIDLTACPKLLAVISWGNCQKSFTYLESIGVKITFECNKNTKSGLLLI